MEHVQDLMMLVELILLVLIWLDGRVMKASALRTESLYENWFKELRAQRLARQQSAARARQTKADKRNGEKTTSTEESSTGPESGGTDSNQTTAGGTEEDPAATEKIALDIMNQP